MNAPFFASEEESTPPAPPAAAAAATTEVPPPPLASPSTTSEADALDQMTMEEEVEVLASKEISKMKRASNLRNANGVEYAPWMNITPEAEGDIKKNDETKSRGTS